MLNRRKPPTAASIVFDLDGTIADTAQDLVDAANAALVSEGIAPAPPEAIKKGVGYGAKAMLESALKSLGLESDSQQIHRLSVQLVRHYERNITVKTRLFPGFRNAALHLRLKGAKLLLCTNKREALTLPILAALGIEPLFDAVAGGDTFPFHKPDPRHITGLIESAGGDKSVSIMIGDSEADIEAARAAGIPVIATSFGYAAVPAQYLGADAIMGHFDELPELIGQFLPQANLF